MALLRAPVGPKMDGLNLGVTAVMLPELDFDDQVELCVSLGVRFYQIRPRRIPEDQKKEPYSPWGNHRFDLTPESLPAKGPRLLEDLSQAGMKPWGTLPTASIADPDEALLLHLKGAAAAGAGRMRLGPAPYPPGTFDYSAYLESTVERYKHVVKRLARPLGIRLLIETHTGGAAASPGLAANIVRRFDPADVGVIFDIANFAREGEIAPSLAVSVLRDWIDCAHIGGSRRV
jgi:sugar phosphate isomerase/epimerase